MICILGNDISSFVFSYKFYKVFSIEKIKTLFVTLNNCKLAY